MTQPDSWKSFTSLNSTTYRVTTTLLGYLPREWKGRILELGCASGNSLFHLAEQLPNAQFVGVDICEANIRSAREHLAQSPNRSRIRFEHADYLESPSGKFDVIYSWYVLHLIPGSDAVLFGKLAADLNDDGLLVCTLPYDCFFNRCLCGVRKVCRVSRFLWLDRLFLQLARLVYRGRVPDERLRERIEYMYHPAQHSDCRALRKQLKELHLERIAEESEPHPSFAALKSRLFVLHKSGSVVSGSEAA